MGTPLTGRVALVTGAAGQGIGSRTAEHLASLGATVVLNGTDAAALELAAERVRRVGPEPMLALADITDSAAVTRIVHEAMARYRRIDILVNNAARGAEPRPFYELSDAAWQADLDVMLTGSFYCTRAVSQQMIRQHAGRVIFVSSCAAFRGTWARAASYAACKAALTGLCRQVALELAQHGITVNAVAPSLVDTPRIRRNQRRTDESIARYARDLVPLGRVATAQEVAAVIGFLASDDSSYVTGQTLIVDGGSSLATAATRL